MKSYEIKFLLKIEDHNWYDLYEFDNVIDIEIKEGNLSFIDLNEQIIKVFKTENMYDLKIKENK